MGRAFEYRKATKLKRWGHMAKTFTRLGKQIAIAVKAGGPEPENNPTLRGVIDPGPSPRRKPGQIARWHREWCRIWSLWCAGCTGESPDSTDRW